jgi:hypothetical protein
MRLVEPACTGTFGLVTLELGPDDKRMRLRYAGTCRLCDQALAAGVEAIYERGAKTVRARGR